ncbi:MAG TPA: class I SAM-dependent methyltransferase [Gaiellaceae bacterium]|jgi:SAM-dependent methyltransferase|nr:class I SAM-dependent methyltransferase [Gaiellaceae bacterium]
MTDPKEVVRRGYDSIAQRISEWKVPGVPRRRLVAQLLDLLPPAGADVLELGCGEGLPAARMLAERHTYTGVDISPVQVERARRNVPGATFVEADYTRVELPPESFDAVVAILTITHVPREEHAGLLRAIFGWLRPGGYFLASFGVSDLAGDVDEDWLGAPMFFSHFDSETNQALLRDAGFELLLDEVVAQDEGDLGIARFLWVIATKPK